jgi:hypothetical protein
MADNLDPANAEGKRGSPLCFDRTPQTAVKAMTPDLAAYGVEA